MDKLEKTLRVTLELKVVPLSEDELAEGNRDLPEDAHMTQEDAIQECEPFELGDVIQGMFQEDSVREAFAGSNIYVTFDGQPLVIEAEFQD